MTYTWKFKPLTSSEPISTQQLAEQLGIHPVLAKLLSDRNIRTTEEARRFFQPDLKELHDPFLMKDMDKAVERLSTAIHENQKILVYGDYDVDGTTSVSLVYKYLHQFYSNLGFYIPDRYNEGYGISTQGIDFAFENDFKLIIALDCGIKAIEKIAYANEKGVDFIICDHHTTDDTLPAAVAVLDPKRADCDYPFKHLSGCGVGFKLMQAFAMKNNMEFSTLIPLMDLLALSIASDIVPITGENRILAYYGLKQLNSNPNTGIKSIIDVCGLSEKEITISDIVFKIGPRINASGRMKLASEAVELLITNDPVFARSKSSTINNYNNDRKDLDKVITDEALGLIGDDIDFDDKKAIVVYKPDWHKGVIGIVASRLSEEHYKPTVVLTLSNGLASGSARSVPGFDIYSAIDSCRDLLENFGGHRYAAGLSLKPERVPEFQQRFENYVSEKILKEQTIPQLDIDAKIGFGDINIDFVKTLKLFGPFGPGNSKPVFSTSNVVDSGASKLVGKNSEHLKLDLMDAAIPAVQMGGIAFNMGKYCDPLKSRQSLDICYTIEENTFNGSTTIQLMIKDIHASD